MPQNIFDNDAFFEGYQRLRREANNYNALVEQPAMRALAPDVAGKAVLDMGCGTGEGCRLFADRGAAQVTGIDLSEKMLAVARRENSGPGITYRQLDMEAVDALDGPFDLVFSSLAMHYAANFAGLLAKLAVRMPVGGVLLFSQEHPMVTCRGDGPLWQLDAAGDKRYALVTDYMFPGPRRATWFGQTYDIYHRPMDQIVNGLCGAALPWTAWWSRCPTKKPGGWPPARRTIGCAPAASSYGQCGVDPLSAKCTLLLW